MSYTYPKRLPNVCLEDGIFASYRRYGAKFSKIMRFDDAGRNLISEVHTSGRRGTETVIQRAHGMSNNLHKRETYTFD